MPITTFRRNLIDLLFHKEGGRCRYCSRAVRKNYYSETYEFDDATIDHIVPKSKGGTNDRDNLALSCRACNHAKGDRDLNEFMADPRPASERPSTAAVRRRLRRMGIDTSGTIPTEYSDARAQAAFAAVYKDRLHLLRPPKEPAAGKGTLARAIQNGEVSPSCEYVKQPKPATLPDPRPRGKKMTAAETAKWLRESAERRGKAWPLA